MTHELIPRVGFQLQLLERQTRTWTAPRLLGVGKIEPAAGYLQLAGCKMQERNPKPYLNPNQTLIRVDGTCTARAIRADTTVKWIR